MSRIKKLADGYEIEDIKVWYQNNELTIYCEPTTSYNYQTKVREWI
jgi:hypothetical protein